MDEYTAEDLSKKIGIGTEQIVREEYELILLREITASPVLNTLIFKGGTALRLGYGGPRFSDDLDFSITAAESWDDFRSEMEAIGKRIPALRLSDLANKRYTWFGQFQIKDAVLPFPFRIKVEVSKRVEPWKAGKDYAAQKLASPVAPIIVVANTVTLERLYQGKKSAFQSRGLPRDIYDIWYLSVRLGKPFSVKEIELSPKAIRKDLYRLLPKAERAGFDKILASL